MDRPKSLASLLMIVVFLIAQIPFSVAEWIAVGDAPVDEGTYDVVIEAIFEGVTGTFPLQLEVGETNYSSEGLTVEPVYPMGKTPPIELVYDIQKNGSKDFIMVTNTLEIYYVTGNTLLKSEPMALVWDNDTYWHALVNVPFKGEYKAVVSVVIDYEGEMYGGEFITRFISDETSPMLELEVDYETRVLIPAESFDITAEVMFEGSPLEKLENINANIYGDLKGLTWDRREKRYEATFTAPGTEGAYRSSVYIEEQSLIDYDKIYVAEIGKAKSARCPLAYEELSGCTDMKDVRKCVSDYKSKIIQITEESLIECFKAVTGDIVQGSIICESMFIGDLDGDEELDLDDLEVMQNLIMPLSQSQRQEYVRCADYDRDEDVDEDDLACMTNVVAEKWFGDLNGGICFDAVYDSPLKCDLTGDGFIEEDDSDLLDEIISAADDGVEMSEEILEACDFDENSNIGESDKTCIKYFLGMDLDDPETLLGTGQTIPDSCMSIYNLDECQGIKGDMNGDLVIDSVDEILIMLAAEKQITGYSMSCADVNKDGRLTDEDIICVKSYVEGDKDSYYICIGCTENLDAAYRSETEICGDGYDNDCDGLIDRTSADGGDLCTCGSDTPCWMVFDMDGGASPGVGDGNYQVCRKAGWLSGDDVPGGSAGGGYQWIDPASLTCAEDKACESVVCSTSATKCAFDGTNWDWFGEMPEETDDPEASPKLCEDGYDNDCDGEDIACEEEEEDEDDQDSLWWGLLAGFVLGYLLGPQASQLIGMAATVGGAAFCDKEDTDCQQFMMGFGMGMMLGGGVKGAVKDAGGWKGIKDDVKGWFKGGKGAQQTPGGPGATAPEGLVDAQLTPPDNVAGGTTQTLDNGATVSTDYGYDGSTYTRADNPDGSTVLRHQDPNGNVVAEQYITADGQTSTTTTYEYHNDRIVSTTSNSGTGETTTTVRETDSGLTTYEKTTYADGHVQEVEYDHWADTPTAYYSEGTADGSARDVWSEPIVSSPPSDPPPSIDTSSQAGIAGSPSGGSFTDSEGTIYQVTSDGGYTEWTKNADGSMTGTHYGDSRTPDWQTRLPSTWEDVLGVHSGSPHPMDRPTGTDTTSTTGTGGTSTTGDTGLDASGGPVV